MTLFDKIKALYPDLTSEDFELFGGTILLRNDSDGRGDYVAKWDHPRHPRPTDQQLANVSEKL